MVLHRLIEADRIFTFSLVDQSTAEKNGPAIHQSSRFGAVFVEDENEIDPVEFKSTHSKRKRNTG